MAVVAILPPPEVGAVAPVQAPAAVRQRLVRPRQDDAVLDLAKLLELRPDLEAQRVLDVEVGAGGDLNPVVLSVEVQTLP